jgi:hypothetical protein
MPLCNSQPGLSDRFLYYGDTAGVTVLFQHGQAEQALSGPRDVPVTTLTLLCIPTDRPKRLTRCSFALPDTLHAHVFFVRLGVDTQEAAIFLLQRVAVGEQTLIGLL